MPDTGEAITNNDCYLYYTPDEGATPTWVLIVEAKDTNWGGDATTASASSRASEFEFEAVVSLKEGPLTFNYLITKGTDAVLNALTAARLAKTHLRFAQMDGPIATAGSRGRTAWMQVKKVDETEAEGGVKQASIECVSVRHVHSSAIVEPAILVVSS